MIMPARIAFRQRIAAFIQHLDRRPPSKLFNVHFGEQAANGTLGELPFSFLDPPASR
jgi:hypothetical protein